MDFDQKPDLTKINATVKVSDMISELRLTFQPIDYGKVEEIIVAIEKTISEDVGYWKREYDLMEKKYREAMVARLFVEEELSESKRKLGELRDQVARLEENRRLEQQKEILVAKEKRLSEEIGRLKRDNDLQVKKLEKEVKARLSIDEELSKCKGELFGMRDRLVCLEEDKTMNLEREKRARDKFTKLLEVFEKVKRENRDLVMRKTLSESAKIKAERELESSKKKNVEMDMRITQLEEDTELINKLLQKSKDGEGKEFMKVSSALKAPVGIRSSYPSETQLKKVISDGKGGSYIVSDDGVNWPKEAGSVIRPRTEGISIPNQIKEGIGESSRRDFQKEKRQKIGTIDCKTEFAVIEISDSDTEMQENHLA